MRAKPFYLTMHASTDGQTDRVIPVYPPNFVAGGIKMLGFFRCTETKLLIPFKVTTVCSYVLWCYSTVLRTVMSELLRKNLEKMVSYTTQTIYRTTIKGKSSDQVLYQKMAKTTQGTTKTSMTQLWISYGKLEWQKPNWCGKVVYGAKTSLFP